jgi:diacylglycerol kinase family enzyme
MSGGAATSCFVRRVEAVVNTASGSVGPTAPAELGEILDSFGLEHRIHTPDGDLETCIAEALSRKPDLLVVLAGDGTARAAAALAGPDGPLLATLPGGTMNMLPHALYGQRSWQVALGDALSNGVAHPVSGGEIDGHPFYCAAMLGSPALLAPAREAARHGQLRRAIRRTRVAFGAAFAGRLRYALEGGTPRKVEALSLICPLISRVLEEHELALEVAALNPKNAADLIGLGLHAALGDWRADRNVRTDLARRVRVWAKGRIPAILDGETVNIGSVAEVRFIPLAFRALVHADDPVCAPGDLPVSLPAPNPAAA